MPIYKGTNTVNPVRINVGGTKELQKVYHGETLVWQKPSNDGFITEWDLPSGNFTLPLRSGYTYDMTVDWGDGNSSTVTAWDDANATHNYSSSGTYQITITGTCETIYINNNLSIRSYLKEVIQWGNVGFTSFEKSFYFATHLTQIPDGPITGVASGCTNFSRIFSNTTLQSIPSGLFDNCTDANNFSYAFRQTSITSIPSGLFDNCTSVTNFQGVFYTNNITSIPDDLFYYNTLATNFSYSFTNCTLLTYIPSDLFGNTAATTFYWAFYCFSTSGYTGAVPDLWNTFSGATSTKCFYNMTNASNYASIPATWK